MDKKRLPVTPESLLLKNLGLFYGLITNADVRCDIDILCETLTRIINKRNSAPKRMSVNTGERFFLMLFKQKYLELIDLEYTTKVDSEEIKMIKQVNKKLNERSVSVEEYLTWVFDVFFNDDFNAKRPPTIKRVCGNYIMATFLINNKKKIKSKKTANNVINREKRVVEYAKKLFLSTKNNKIKELLQKFEEGILSVGDLERKLKELTA